MLTDFRLAVRSLRHTPVFAVTAILTLAVGIGGGTAIFSIVNAVLLRPLPYRDPSRLVQIWESNPGQGKERSEVSAGTFVDWQQRSRSFDGLALFSADIGMADARVLSTKIGPLQIHETAVTPNLFSLLGVQPFIGRDFSASSRSSAPNGSNEVIVSFDLWQRAFAADATILGQMVRLEGRSGYVVVGVMPPGFSFPGTTELWSGQDLSSVGPGRRIMRFDSVIGRLKPGLAIAAAERELAEISRDLEREYPASNAGWTVALTSLQDATVGTYRLPMFTLLAAIGFVLLIGCANVSNLLLARGVSRRRALAVRAALGASRGRIVRQLLTETAVLTGIGGVAGWCLAVSTLPILVRLASTLAPRALDVQLSGPALLFCALTCVATTLVVGLVPALQGSRGDFQPALAAENERATMTAGASRLQRFFVSSEIAATLILIVGAALLVQTFVRLRQVDPGFDPGQVISIDIRVPIFRFGTEMEQRVRAWNLVATQSNEIIARLGQVPGVRSIATTNEIPLSGRSLETDLTIHSGGTARRAGVARYQLVSPNYFRTMGMTLLQGRDFTNEDISGLASALDMRSARPRQGVAIINETAALALWPSGDALGQFLSTSYDTKLTPRRQVVGIVRNARSDSLRRAAPAEVYVPYLENPSFAMTAVARTALPLNTIAPALRSAVQAVDPEVSAAHIRMLEEVVSESIQAESFTAMIVSAFAVLALALAAIGVYGVLAFGISRRTREIGIRVALGATTGDVTRLFLAQAMTPITLGVAGGVVGAVALGRLVRTLLFGVAPTDPVSFLAAVAVLTAVALVASYLPIRRALKNDPAHALRT